MRIKSVAVLGAGAVGSYIIWGLSNRKDIKLGVIAEGERKERLEKNGCLINEKVYHPEVWTPSEANGVDLLIVSLKYGALPGAVDSIKEAVGDNTIIMSLMNGVDSEEIISEKVDASHILHSLIKVASHKEGTGYCFDPETTIGIIFGEISAPFESERVEEIKELFADTGLHFRATEYIREEMWSKYRLNICNNLKKEVEAVAAAKGIDMSKVDIKSARGSAVPPTARYSTLQDIDAGRHTEIDMFSGALVRMGKELGVPTPYNEYTYHMIKALEEKNDGLFDYDGKNAETTCAK